MRGRSQRQASALFMTVSGRTLPLNDEVYASATQTNYRNQSIDAVEIGWLQGAGAGRDREALVQQGLEALLAHAVAPAGDRERSSGRVCFF
jgi:hypothetical protein